MPNRSERGRIANSDSDIASYIEERESLLSPLASKSLKALRRYNRREKDIRTPYSRDADRIIHTRAYTRYIDKTQVFYLIDNDHITHRVIHVQLVSRIARTIGRSLRLNEDLIEAIALGHDIGHIPFGHFGETCLSEQCKKNKIGKFFHNVQSVQFLDKIEDCDLTMQVLDGILCHNGESDDIRISSLPCNGWNDFDDKVAQYAGDQSNPPPMTLEGCVVKFADTIAYIGRDLQDAAEVGLISAGKMPPSRCTEILGSTNREIINTLIYDLIRNSDTTEKGFISYSPDVEKALIDLRLFSRINIYENKKLTSEREKIRAMFETLFDIFLTDVEKGNRRSKIYTDFIDSRWISDDYRKSATAPEFVRDFIAGMTDRYFAKRYEECVLPRRVEGKFL